MPPTVCGVGSSKSRVVSGKQKWGRRSPAAVRCFESASKLAHSKRFATSETPCGSAAAHGLLRLAAAVGDERGWKPALQRDAISTGGSRAAWSWSYRRAVARAKRWPSRVVCGNTRSGWTIGVRNAGRNGRAAGRWMWVAGRFRVHSGGLASLGLRPGKKLCGVGRPSDAASAGACCARTVAPPRGPKN